MKNQYGKDSSRCTEKTFLTCSQLSQSTTNKEHANGKVPATRLDVVRARQSCSAAVPGAIA